MYQPPALRHLNTCPIAYISVIDTAKIESACMSLGTA